MHYEDGVKIIYLSDTSTFWDELIYRDHLLKKVNNWLSKDILKSNYKLEISELISIDSASQNLPQSFEEYFIEAAESIEEDCDVNDVIQQIREDWESTNLVKLLNLHTDIKENFVWFLYEDVESNRENVENWETLTFDEQIGYSRNLANDLAASRGDHFFLAEVLYKRFAANHPAAQEIFANHFDRATLSSNISKTLKSSVADSRKEIVLRDLRYDTTVSLQDVGVGISQILPILIHAYGESEKLIAIEQPEIHIHPALQAEIGDLFIESALGENKNTFVLETHSEHLILRILRRIRETTRGQLKEGLTPITKDDIAVLYVQPGEDGAEVKELRVSEHGQFIDSWPNGFFEERFNEEF